MRAALVWTVIFSMAGCGLCARILAVLPFPGKSHYVFLSAILKTLVQRGHEVVEYSPYPPSKPLPNFTHVEIHVSLENIVKSWTYEDFIEIANENKPLWGYGFKGIWDMTYGVCEEALQHKELQKLLNSKEHYDLVFTESSFGQESMVVFGHKFSAPTISLQGFPTWCGINRDAGNALSIATLPDFNSFVATDQLSFTERFCNLISTALTLHGYYNYHLPLHEKIIRENYQGDIPPLTDMVGNISLYLINAHPAIEYTRPYSPNIIPIAGITISPDRTPLPKELQKFMDEAKEGVIYFSLGTVVPAHVMPMEVLQIFVNAFKKIPNKVIWKIDLDNIPGLSGNVMLSKWLPQPGILAHPNCVLFLTHGGLFGQQEAIYAGVPTVGIPFFGDQPYNVRFSEYLGTGVKLDFTTLSEETVLSALASVLSNSKYKENAMRLSRIFRDRPLSPADSVVYWVEYVLRHGGAHHLRPAAARLPWYQLTLLDILAIIVAAVLATFITLYLIIKKILSLVFSTNKKSEKSKKKKKD